MFETVWENENMKASPAFRHWVRTIRAFGLVREKHMLPVVRFCDLFSWVFELWSCHTSLHFTNCVSHFRFPSNGNSKLKIPTVVKCLCSSAAQDFNIARHCTAFDFAWCASASQQIKGSATVSRCSASQKGLPWGCSSTVGILSCCIIGSCGAAGGTSTTQHGANGPWGAGSFGEITCEKLGTRANSNSGLP